MRIIKSDTIDPEMLCRFVKLKLLYQFESEVNDEAITHRGAQRKQPAIVFHGSPGCNIGHNCAELHQRYGITVVYAYRPIMITYFRKQISESIHAFRTHIFDGVNPLTACGMLGH